MTDGKQSEGCASHVKARGKKNLNIKADISKFGKAQEEEEDKQVNGSIIVGKATHERLSKDTAKWIEKKREQLLEKNILEYEVRAVGGILMI